MASWPCYSDLAATDKIFSFKDLEAENVYFCLKMEKREITKDKKKEEAYAVYLFHRDHSDGLKKYWAPSTLKEKLVKEGKPLPCFLVYHGLKRGRTGNEYHDISYLPFKKSMFENEDWYINVSFFFIKKNKFVLLIFFKILYP